MSDNPYQTPQGELIYPADTPPASAFYLVSKKKMIVLFIVTLGIYQVFWYYQNWRFYKLATGEKIWPLPRAIFSIFFVHSLFRAVNHLRDRTAAGLMAWNHSQQATIIVLLLIISQVMDRLSSKSIGSPVTDVLSLLILFPLVACHASAQDKINEACGDPLGASNNRFTVGNYIWIVLGVLMWALIGIGLFVPPEQL
jgi:hypothetical protein